MKRKKAKKYWLVARLRISNILKPIVNFGIFVIYVPSALLIVLSGLIFFNVNLDVLTKDNFFTSLISSFVGGAIGLGGVWYQVSRSNKENNVALQFEKIYAPLLEGIVVAANSLKNGETNNEKFDIEKSVEFLDRKYRIPPLPRLYLDRFSNVFKSFKEKENQIISDWSNFLSQYLLKENLGLNGRGDNEIVKPILVGTMPNVILSRNGLILEPEENLKHVSEMTKVFFTFQSVIDFRCDYLELESLILELKKYYEIQVKKNIKIVSEV